MLVEADCVVDYNGKDGTITAKDGDTVVFRAIRKGGRGQPWIAIFRESDTIKWAHYNSNDEYKYN